MQKLSRNTKCFMAANFASVFGDSLLVTALPIGLAAEKNDVRFSVYLWIVPAVAMFIASFFGRVMIRRSTTASVDYSKILYGLFFSEILLCFLMYFGHSDRTEFIMILVFLFLYAFSKEGIPRLFYVVDIYSYFVKKEDIARISGYNFGLGIVATAAAVSVSALLIGSGNWRLCLLIDALTFLILAVTIQFYGKQNFKIQELSDFTELQSNDTVLIRTHECSDPEMKVAHEQTGSFKKRLSVGNSLNSIAVDADDVASDDSHKEIAEPEFSAEKRSPQSDMRNSKIKAIGIFVPFLFGVSALFLNHIQLLAASKLDWTLETIILIFHLFKIPGVVAGFFSSFLRSFLGKAEVYFFLFILFVSSLMFCLRPSSITLAICAVVLGLIAGLYWSIDTAIRAELDSTIQIVFNSYVLRALACSQLLGCMLSVLILTNFKDNPYPFFLIATLSIFAISLLFGELISQKIKVKR